MTVIVYETGNVYCKFLIDSYSNQLWSKVVCEPGSSISNFYLERVISTEIASCVHKLKLHRVIAYYQLEIRQWRAYYEGEVRLIKLYPSWQGEHGI